MLAVRADERAAAAAGINVVRVKLIGFAIAAFIAGLGGSLLAYQLGNVTFQDFDAFLGLVTFSVVVVAGITSVSGGILAGIISAGGILVAVISSGRRQRRGGQLVRRRGRHRGGPDGDLQPGRHRGADPSLLGAAAGAGRPGPTRGRAGAVGAGGVGDARAEPTPTPTPGRALGVGRRPRPASWSGAAPASGPTATRKRRRTGRCTAGPLLEVRNLTVRYGGVVAVDDVSFSVEAGQIVGLIGPNGAGKTTTIDALCGFHPYEGSVVLAGTGRGGLRTAPPGGPRARPHVPAGRGLRRPDRRGERPGRTAQGGGPRHRRADEDPRGARPRRDARPAGVDALAGPAPTRLGGPRPGRRARASSCSTSRRPGSTAPRASGWPTGCGRYATRA